MIIHFMCRMTISIVFLLNSSYYAQILEQWFLTFHNPFTQYPFLNFKTPKRANYSHDTNHWSRVSLLDYIETLQYFLCSGLINQKTNSLFRTVLIADSLSWPAWNFNPFIIGNKLIKTMTVSNQRKLRISDNFNFDIKSDKNDNIWWSHNFRLI